MMMITMAYHLEFIVLVVLLLLEPGEGIFAHSSMRRNWSWFSLRFRIVIEFLATLHTAKAKTMTLLLVGHRRSLQTKEMVFQVTIETELIRQLAQALF